MARNVKSFTQLHEYVNESRIYVSWEDELRKEPNTGKSFLDIYGLDAFVLVTGRMFDDV